MAVVGKPGNQVIDVSGPLPTRLVLEKDEEVVGRSSECSICVRSVMVSRRHAVFSRDAASGLWRVADDASMNGVYVNGQRVEPERPQALRQDDVVSLGPPQRTNLVFRFVTDDPRHRGGDAGQRPKDSAARPRAFLVVIGGSNQPPRGADANGKVAVSRGATHAADDSECDGSPVLPSDRDNNNVSSRSGVSPNGYGAAGRGDCVFSKNSKKIRLSAGDSVVRRVESIMENELTCAICSELFVDAAMLQCGHTFCSYCIQNWQKQKNVCPFCLVTISSITRSFVVDNIIDELVCFNPELKRFRETLAHSRLAAAFGDSAKN
ncbi:E3 ubiquitin-protein ligase CHFR-like [Amblyomma americanum]